MEKTKSQRLNIVFFGTPDFAAHQLEALINQAYNIVAVVTTPDRPQGRGKKLKACAVKEMALANNIPVLEPNNLKATDFLEDLKAYKPDLQIIVAFRMLPEAVWSLPNFGTINLHASYLPNYRGAAPINWALINGESYTGISTFLLKHEIDTGAILLRKKIEINSNDNFESLYNKLMKAGPELLKSTIDGYIKGEIKAQNQEDLLKAEDIIVKEAPKLDSKTGKIDWNRPAIDIINLIKGLSPVPCAYTFVKIKGKNALKLKIFNAEISESKSNANPGDIFLNENKELKIQCQNSAICLNRLQLEGKKPINAKDFINGIDIETMQTVENNQ